MKETEILLLSVEALKKKLSESALPTTGNKKELQNRLLSHFKTDNISVDDADEYGEAISDMGSEDRKSQFTFKDVEDSLTTFCGNSKLDIETWLLEFELNAEIVGWSDLQKFVYAKQLLRGAARLFIRSQLHLKDWVSFKST
ncbi:uncharacterized protein LOC119669439 [Teleopsis dalmanni]|uniref:uncharacterized protein LOC119669439 n=1 Tax=Teleopsis dalmanni TaxID=139649 RepID=UPI0018CD24B8|nr:uncharacterized protein LOC119669439 [Teleopsis dalmanni]